MTQTTFEMDIHNIERRHRNAARNLNDHPGIPQETKEKIQRFLEHCQAQDLSLARRLFYLQRLTIIAATLGETPINDACRGDLERVLSEISSRCGRNGQSLGAWTKRGYKITVRVFWRWLKGCEEDENPSETAWIKIKRTKDVKTLPEDLLTKDEVLKMLRVAEHPMHKALLIVGHDLAGRPNEWFTVRVKDVDFDEYSAIVRVKGKNGTRRVRLVLATPSLHQWLELHPCKARPDAPLWVCLEGEHAGEALGYDRARKLLQQIADKAGVKKRVNPYVFRHSTITALATELTEAEMCEIFGWTQGSRMPRVYVHLSGRDVDQKILRIHGVIKESQVEKRTLERRKCQRCGTENPPEGHFCTVCAAPLDSKTALQLDRCRAVADEAMDALIQDPEVQKLLKRKLVELGLVEKLKAS
jgi:site-specific recombinase XerC